MENVRRTEEIAAGNARQGPRITLDMLLGFIKEVHYQRGDAAIDVPADHPLTTMTLCFCVLKNGWMVIGKAAPASAVMYDPEIGRKLAHEDCIRQIWPLLGFVLRQSLYLEEEFYLG
jgi:hypothetical protein